MAEAMAEDGGPCGRLLALIDAMRLSSRDVSLPGVVLFLHVCERDGISIKDLVYLSGYGESLVSRAVDRLRGVDEAGKLVDLGGALVTVTRHPEDGRRRLVFLTEAGKRLKLRISRMLAGLPEEV
jgi:DNA-binding MarR family transcriptional regulator